MEKTIKIKLNNNWYDVCTDQLIQIITEDGYRTVSISLIQDIKTVSYKE